MSITLPPLPDDFKFKGPRKITAQELRARDLEVAKAVLEAAAVTAWTHYMDICKKRKIAPANFEEWLSASAIRNLKVSHAE